MKGTKVRKIDKLSNDSHKLYKVTDLFSSGEIACLMLSTCHNVATVDMKDFKIYLNS